MNVGYGLIGAYILVYTGMAVGIPDIVFLIPLRPSPNERLRYLWDSINI